MSVIAKMHGISAKVPSVQATGHNDFGNYDYAKEADILKVLKPLFDEFGLMITHSIVETKIYQVDTKKGSKEFMAEVKVEYKVYDTEKEHPVILYGYGTGMDDRDKALYKALTGAHKYFLSKNFNLSTGDDPEHDENGETDKTGSSAPTSFDPTLTVPIGKNKGKRITDVSLDDLNKTVSWMKDAKAKDGKPVSESWKHFMEQVELYAKELDAEGGWDNE